MNAPALLRLLVLAVGAMVPSAPGGDVPRSTPRFPLDARLRYVLSSQASYVDGQKVTVRFSLENLSPQPLWVLTWYTPFEGLAGPIFLITRDGREVSYRGVMVKREQPDRNAYLRLDPGKPATVEVDLAPHYDFSRSGQYQVEFVGVIHDLVREADLPPRRAEHQEKSISGNPVTFRVVRP